MITFAQRELNGATVLLPKGRLDMVAAPLLREHIAQTVADGNTRLIIDLSETEFLDSSGLAALVSGLKAAREAKGDLRIARPTEQALLVLDLTSMTRVFYPYASVDDAVNEP
ncbi:MAG: STAS domain-containing protein [Acidimicrobiaceae bacterium]|nr:STAS domain-containing protein [Acidimicrobiaceae bacterium]MBO0746731.1 STAS domain-containing protein [Acidimicrobiaceae bacterium]